MESQHDRFDEFSPPRIGERVAAANEPNLDSIQVRIADKLRQAAGTLFGERHADLTGNPGSFGSQAGTWLNNSADYIEKIEPKKLKTDITEQVRRNPGTSLLVAGAAGLILGAIFRRR